jgi:hypothetical protein
VNYVRVFFDIEYLLDPFFVQATSPFQAKSRVQPKALFASNPARPVPFSFDQALSLSIWPRVMSLPQSLRFDPA